MLKLNELENPIIFSTDVTSPISPKSYQTQNFDMKS